MTIEQILAEFERLRPFIKDKTKEELAERLQRKNLKTKTDRRKAFRAMMDALGVAA